MRICSTEQRLSELPVAHEIHVLLQMQDVRADALERLGDGRRKVRGEHLADDRFRQELQAGALGAVDKLMKVQRQITALEVFMKQIRVAGVAGALRLRCQKLPVRS